MNYSDLVRDVLSKCSGKDTTIDKLKLAVEKLLHLLIYFSILIDCDETLEIFESIKTLNISPLIFVRL